MKASRLFSSLLLALVGFGVGAFLYPGPYVYSTVNGTTLRVNRISGVEQYASARGWVSREEAIRDSMSSTLNGVGSVFRSMARSEPSAPGGIAVKEE